MRNSVVNILVIAALLVGLLAALAAKRMFAKDPESVDQRSRRRAEFFRTFFLWAAMASSPALLFLFRAPAGMLLVLLVPGVAFGLIGAGIMNFVVPPGKTGHAVTVGFAIGAGLPLLLFWSLLAVLPKDEGSLGYFLLGPVFSVPSGLAGVIAGVWRAQNGKALI